MYYCCLLTPPIQYMPVHSIVTSVQLSTNKPANKDDVQSTNIIIIIVYYQCRKFEEYKTKIRLVFLNFSISLFGCHGHLDEPPSVKIARTRPATKTHGILGQFGRRRFIQMSVLGAKLRRSYFDISLRDHHITNVYTPASRRKRACV